MVVPISSCFVDVRTSEGVKRRETSVEADQDSLINVGVLSKNLDAQEVLSGSQLRGSMGEACIARMLPFTPYSIYPNSSSSCIGNDAIKSYLRMDCSKWRPHTSQLQLQSSVTV